MAVARIFHIAEARLWDVALSDGEYRQSTLGRTLDEDGFIHCGRLDQVVPVANAAYRGQRDLVLLVIDRGRVHAEVRDENLEGGTDLFPHIYGPLNLDAVIEVLPFDAGPDGRFGMPT
jgi:glutathione S-transferase